MTEPHSHYTEADKWISTLTNTNNNFSVRPINNEVRGGILHTAN